MTDTTADSSTRLARRLLAPAWVLAALLVASTVWLPGANGLRARYIDGTGTAGRPRHTTTDTAQTGDIVRDRWDGRLPATFTVVWSGYLTIGTPGTYTFALTSSGRSSLALDGQPVIDRATASPDATTGVRRLTSGPHQVELVFTQAGGDVAFDWRWARQGEPPSPVPSWLLSTRPVRYPQAVAMRIARLLAVPMAVVAAMLAAWLGVAWLRRCVRAGVARRLAAWRLPALPRVVTIVLATVAAVLPLLLLAHAFTFWGRGVIDQEAVSFVINYLADRPFLQTIFDPALNDWGLYQARELAYVFDWVDARVFAWLMVDRGVLLFVPLSSVVSIAAITVIYLAGARRVLRLDWTTALLLYALFLSTIVVQASAAILYRSSKIVLTALQLLFFFRALALLGPTRVRVSAGDVAGLAFIGALMAWVDRQGYALSLVVATVAGVLWLRDRWLAPSASRVPRAYGAVAVAAGVTALWAVLYNNVLAPEVIHRLNGYWPDFVFEEIPLVRLDRALVLDTLRMFARQLEYFFGHLPLAGICALALFVWGVVHVHDDEGGDAPGFLGWLTGTGVVLTTAMVGANLVLIAVSGMRHPPVFHIADHALWYYLLPFQGSVLFAASLALSRLPSGPTSRWQPYAWLLLVALVAGNAWHWPAERDFIATSPQYFGKQHEFSRLYTVQYALDAQGADESTRVLPAWMRVRPDAAEVHFPLKDYGFLDAVRASYLTVQRRAPLVDAGGPHWKELREFLDGGASPFLEPAQVTDALAALQAIGIRRFVIHRDQFETAAAADLMLQAVLRLGDRLRDVRNDGPVVVVSLGDARFPRVDTSTWSSTPLPASALRLSASQSSGQLPGLLDGSRDTEWNSATRQVGSEWIRIDLDRPRDLAGIRLDITDEALVRYPRHLRIDVAGASGTTTVFDGSVLPAMLRGLLMEPKAVPMVLPVGAPQVQSLTLRQVGDSPSWGWALRELRLYEEPAR